ncbi:MAG: potassium-transporting ATPase subunit KdpA [Pirellulales bacterium]
MTVSDLLQLLLFLSLLGACVKPLGLYMARIYAGETPWFVRWLRPIEHVVYRICGIDAQAEMNSRTYAISVLWLSGVSVGAVYIVQRVQAWLPLNPDRLPNVARDSAFNTAVSFATNTNWQGYAGEATMSCLTQMSALTVQNFVSAAMGMAVAVALLRGFTRCGTTNLGNFWVDLLRGTLYILLPLSVPLALALVSQGVVQTVQRAAVVKVLDQPSDDVATQSLPLGPVASQIAIKQLGTNGGGYFNANSAHPFENPTPLSNLLEMLAILLIPAALVYSFGELVGDRRQGWALLAAMTVVFVPLVLVVTWAEQGNWEGKELRFGIGPSATWAVATTAASNGSVNSMHDSYSPIGGLAPLWLIQLGEVIFGGVGSGLYGMLLFALVAVFLSGLMVGRTPEYLGKKIGAFEMKMAMVAILLPCAAVLVGTALGVGTTAGRASILNPGPHGFTEVLYAFSSAGNNNGSAFAGLNANTPFYNGWLALAMLIGRFGVMLPVLAIAGSLAQKRTTPATAGTLPTHTPLFVALLAAVVVIVGALSFFPSLALGPIVEQLMLTSRGGTS